VKHRGHLLLILQKKMLRVTSCSHLF